MASDMHLDGDLFDRIDSVDLHLAGEGRACKTRQRFTCSCKRSVYVPHIELVTETGIVTAARGGNGYNSVSGLSK